VPGTAKPVALVTRQRHRRLPVREVEMVRAHYQGLNLQPVDRSVRTPTLRVRILRGLRPASPSERTALPGPG